MPTLKILFLSHHFPPEVSAGASRVYEMSRTWVAAGHEVTVVTCAPNHPAGVLFPGYRNRIWQRQRIDGIDVIRLWSFVAPNKGTVRRTLNYLSYLVSSTLAAPAFPRTDVVVSTSPQFFCGFAGYPVSRLLRKPWVLEIRDLWPESIVAVGAMKPGLVTRALQVLERFSYRRSDVVVSASEAFTPHFQECGIALDKIHLITNGVDLSLFAKSPDAKPFLQQHGLDGKFVASYVGTHGMAHQLEVILEAAALLRERRDIAFLLVGDGAEREHLVEQCRSMALDNVLMLPPVPREMIPTIWAASNAALVTLRPNPVFELVIPSKMFEGMVMRRPIVMGVKGEAQRIVERADCGLTFTPGDAKQLAQRVVTLADDPDLCVRLGNNGYQLATTVYDREAIAGKYLKILEQVVDRGGRR